MGGCRCTFRTCTVNTLKFPGMHFFHYPLKNQTRLEKWVQLAEYSEIYEMSPAQAKNKVVCALHFRDECFMNYKKDRLIPQAVPTLSRLKNGLVLDHSSSDKHNPFALPPTTEKHLVPPKGYVALEIPEECLIDEAVEIIDDEDDVAKPKPKRPRTSKITMLPMILNKGVRLQLNSSLNGNLNDEGLSNITLSDEPFDDQEYGIVLSGNDDQPCESLSNEAIVSVDELINMTEIEILPSEKEESVESENLVSRALYEQMVNSFEREIVQLKQASEKKEWLAEEKIAQLQQLLSASKEAHKNTLAKAAVAEASVEELSKKLETCLLESHELAKAADVRNQKPPGSAPVSMSKAQLFNGIKKYLTASMTALVRMEMFGSSERQWKPDEKQVSVELLRLGSNVYKYFTDEWRFRLPSTSLVQLWTHEVTEEDEEDL